MAFDGKVKLARVFERTSKAGNRYFSGRLGAARLLILEDSRGEENEWTMFLQDGDDNGTKGATRPETTDKSATAAQHDAPLDDPLPEHLR